MIIICLASIIIPSDVLPFNQTSLDYEIKCNEEKKLDGFVIAIM